MSLCLCGKFISAGAICARPKSPVINNPAALFTEALAGAGYLAAEILAIEDPAARDAVLRKFLETGNGSEQIRAALEAAVTRRAQLAEGALGRNDVERAMENFRRAVAVTPERVTDRFFEETVIRIPFALSARGYRNEAVEIARGLERRFAKEPSRLASLGEFYMTIEATGEAIRALEAASKLAGADAKPNRLLGAAYRMGLRLDDAIAKYRLAVGLDANDKRAYYELANLYRARGLTPTRSNSFANSSKSPPNIRRRTKAWRWRISRRATRGGWLRRSIRRDPSAARRKRSRATSTCKRNWPFTSRAE